MSRDVVDAKWPAIRRAFRNFEPDEVAALLPGEIEAIAVDPAVIRNRRKIESVVANARVLVEIIETCGSFDAYLGGYPDFDSKSSALRRDFRHLGEFGAYFVLYIIGEDVPPPKEQWKRSV